MKTGQKRLKHKTEEVAWKGEAKQSPRTWRSRSGQCRRRWRGNVHTCWHLKGTRAGTAAHHALMALNNHQLIFLLLLSPEALPNSLWTSKCYHGLAKSWHPPLKQSWNAKTFITVETVWILGQYLKEGAENPDHPRVSLVQMVGNTAKVPKSDCNLQSIFSCFLFCGRHSRDPSGNAQLQKDLVPVTWVWPMAAGEQSHLEVHFSPFKS